ncbi:MAG: enoyl-CoA hydratase [Hyphomicrobiaceae bacterium]
MSSSVPGRIRFHAEAGIAWVTFDNEPRLNAFTRDMWSALPDVMAKAEADSSVRVIVLTGAGSKAFSAGADISEFGQNRTGEAASVYEEINHRAFMAVTGATKPTIAMVGGYCFGGGCELAICCDLRVASDTAIFSVPAAKLSVGYNPRWIRPMLSVMSAAKAKEMLYTGRRYPATEALAMGLVNSVVPLAGLAEETRRLAREIAENAPLTVRAAKASVDALVAGAGEADLAPLDELVLACFDSEDFKEGARAFMEKRKPVFRGK